MSMQKGDTHRPRYTITEAGRAVVAQLRTSAPPAQPSSGTSGRHTITPAGRALLAKLAEERAASAEQSAE